jgi:hypothetical protein
VAAEVVVMAAAVLVAVADSMVAVSKVAVIASVAVSALVAVSKVAVIASVAVSALVVASVAVATIMHHLTVAIMAIPVTAPQLIGAIITILFAVTMAAIIILEVIGVSPILLLVWASIGGAGIITLTRIIISATVIFKLAIAWKYKRTRLEMPTRFRSLMVIGNLCLVNKAKGFSQVNK